LGQVVRLPLIAVRRAIRLATSHALCIERHEIDALRAQEQAHHEQRQMSYNQLKQQYEKAAPRHDELKQKCEAARAHLEDNFQLTPEEFVAALYVAVLHRAADSAGLAHWSRVITDTGDYTAVLARFVESDEFKAANRCEDRRAIKDKETIRFFSAPILAPVDEHVESVKAQALQHLGLHSHPRPAKMQHYSEHLFLRYLENYRSATEPIDHGSVMALLKQAIGFELAASPLQKTLFALYQHHFRIENRAALYKFGQHCKDATLIVIHCSCSPRMWQAEMSVRSFPTNGSIAHVIVIGHPMGREGQYEFHEEIRTLTVPANDFYEGLSEKMASVYAFISFAGTQACILKIDDEIRCTDQEALISEILPLVQARDYIGVAWYHGQYEVKRWWHVGKCHDRSLNERPYGLIVNADYANGPSYAVSSRAVNILGKASICLEGQFRAELYEDLAVGKILNHFGIIPTNFDLIRSDILAVQEFSDDIPTLIP